MNMIRDTWYAGALTKLFEQLVALGDRIPGSVIALMARASVATVFWKSGRTKVDGWSVTDTAVLLFEYEYSLPLIPPEWAAWMAAGAEHFFPMLLIIGLASRLSALALLAMTLVIQTFVYPDAWTVHLLWATALVYIIARGPGVLSLDHLLKPARG